MKEQSVTALQFAIRQGFPQKALLFGLVTFNKREVVYFVFLSEAGSLLEPTMKSKLALHSGELLLSLPPECRDYQRESLRPLQREKMPSTLAGWGPSTPTWVE